jgi:hypothetical protein
MATLDKGIAERLNQLEKLRKKIEALGERRSDSHQSFCRVWPQTLDRFGELQNHAGDLQKMDGFLEAIGETSQKNGPHYIDAIKGLSRSQAELGSQWLKSIVDHLMDEMTDGII